MYKRAKKIDHRIPPHHKKITHKKINPLSFGKIHRTTNDIDLNNALSPKHRSGHRKPVVATYSGGVPRRLNEVKTTCTLWPGPARKV